MATLCDICISLPLNEGVGKPKELSKAVKSLRLPNKISSCEVSALRVNKIVQHDIDLVLDRFKDYYFNLLVNLLKNISKPPNKFTLNTVIQNYNYVIQSDSFNVASLSKTNILLYRS